jgi:hypothetical protein
MMLAIAERSVEDGSLLMVDPKTLSEFGKCSLALVECLENDPFLDPSEQLFIENHISILRLVLSAQKHHESIRRSK